MPGDALSGRTQLSAELCICAAPSQSLWVVRLQRTMSRLPVSSRCCLVRCREADRLVIVRTYWWRRSRSAADTQRTDQFSQPAQFTPGDDNEPSRATATTVPPARGDSAPAARSGHGAGSAAVHRPRSAAAGAKPWSALNSPATIAAQPQPQPGQLRRSRPRFAFLAALKAELRCARQRNQRQQLFDRAARQTRAVQASWQSPVKGDMPPASSEKLLAGPQPLRTAASARASPRRRPRSAYRSVDHNSRRSPPKALPTGPASYAQRTRTVLPGN